MKITKSEITITMTMEEAQELRNYLYLASQYLERDITNERITARAYKDELAKMPNNSEEWKTQMQATIDGLENESEKYQLKVNKIKELRVNIFDAVVE